MGKKGIWIQKTPSTLALPGQQMALNSSLSVENTTIATRPLHMKQTVAQRGGYAGVTLFLYVDDFHEGSSDTPVWSIDGKSIFFTARRKKAVELLEISPGNEEKQLTQSLKGESHYHPKPSPDGHWILQGGHRKGIRDLCKQHLETGVEIRLTHLTQGKAAMGLIGSLSQQPSPHPSLNPEKETLPPKKIPLPKLVFRERQAMPVLDPILETAFQQLPERGFHRRRLPRCRDRRQ